MRKRQNKEWRGKGKKECERRKRRRKKDRERKRLRGIGKRETNIEEIRKERREGEK